MLACFFPDGYSYQENMLPKFHKQAGHDVEVIASLQTFDENGQVTYLEKPSRYTNEHGVKVTRLAYKKPCEIFRKLKKYKGTYSALCESKPDILFIHGCQFLDASIVAKYCKENPDVRVFVDNHADFTNSARSFFSKKIMHGILWRHTAALLNRVAIKFYGVLPARVDFLRNVYNLPEKKIELLVMGADDDLIKSAMVKKSKRAVRQKYNIRDDDFLIVTGGKIDLFKVETLTLMRAVRDIDIPNIKLLVFGSVVPELKSQIEELAKSDNITFIGWISSDETYPIIAAADLCVYPGRHSVLWEQTAGQGIPMLQRRHFGTEHTNICGNVRFIDNPTVENLIFEIKYLTQHTKELDEMKKAAMAAANTFLYSNIAKRCIEK